MWDRAILKENAKMALSGGKYWTAYAVCVISSLIVGCFSVVNGFLETKPDYIAMNTDPYESSLYAEQIVARWKWVWFPNLLLVIFVALPLTVGISRFFVRNRFGETKLETMFSCFRDGYASTTGAMFTTRLLTILWTFLLIIPGIVKALEYSMVPFILSDNPSMPGSRARQISKIMTNGQKGAIFVLYLSFLGWYLLAGLVVGTLTELFWPISGLASVAVTPFVLAYQNATLAELYIFLRDRAIRSGMVNPIELGLAPSAV
jgi:hypothetical protein